MRGGVFTPQVIHENDGSYDDITAVSFAGTGVSVTGTEDTIYMLSELPFNTFDITSTGLDGNDVEYYSSTTSAFAAVTDIMHQSHLTTGREVFQIPDDWGRLTIKEFKTAISIATTGADDNYTKYYVLKVDPTGGSGTLVIKPVIGPEDMAEIQVYDSDNAGRFSPTDQSITIVDGDGNTFDTHWVIKEMSWSINSNLSDDTHGYAAAGTVNEGTPQFITPAMREVSGSCTMLYDGDDSIFNTFKEGINRAHGIGYWQQIKIVANKNSAKFDEYFELKMNNLRLMDVTPGGATTEPGEKTFSFEFSAWKDSAAGLDSDSVSMLREVVMEVGQ